MLFNVYLDDILKKSALLQKISNRGDLVAYADDILLMADTKEELNQALSEFESLE